MLRKIAVFTGNRAEYGLQVPILEAIRRHPDLQYYLLASGAHLDPDFGKTLAEIHADGFDVFAEVKINMPVDGGRTATALAVGSGILSMTEVLNELEPDILVVYADRFEGLAAVTAGSQMNIPVAHIEGGDLTEGGALDDSVRHAMTKLSHLHFTTNQQATNRILAMGEEAWRVHTVGFPAVDAISKGEYATPDSLASLLNLDYTRPIVLFTQHSVTTQFSQAASQLRPSLAAMRQLAEESIQVILTYPNNDAGSHEIIAELEAFITGDLKNVQLHRSLGRYNYRGLLALARDTEKRIVCVGNSSSGLKETPAFGCPAVNIGSRQDGRLRGSNVIDTRYDAAEIFAAVQHCLTNVGFREACRNGPNPYGTGDAGIKVAKVLAEVKLDQSLLRKKMMLKGEVQNGWFR